MNVMRRTGAIKFALYCIVAAVPNLAAAQTFRPLSEIISGEYEPTYPFVRCAALFQSTIEWAGKNRVGQSTFEKADNSIKELLSRSIIYRARNSGISVENAQKNTLSNTRVIADLYLKRYKENYANTGQAWGSDIVWKNDLQICQKLVSGLQ